MRSSCCLAVPRKLIVFKIALMLAATMTLPVQAQQIQQEPQLPPGLLGSNELDEDQQQAVLQFVDFFAARMLNADDPSQISDARQRLTQPMGDPRTSDAVHQAFSEAIADALSPVMEQNDRAVRLNAIILIEQLSGSVEQVVPLIADSLAHSSAAVRYRAARAVREWLEPQDGQGPSLTAEQDQELAAALAVALADETNVRVLENMFQLAGMLESPDARLVALDVLSARATRYSGGLHPGLHADQQGLNSIANGLLADDERGEDIDQALRQLTAVAARLLDSVTEHLQGLDDPQEDISADLLAASLLIVERAEGVFSVSLTHFDPAAQGGPSLIDLAEDGAFQELREAALQWIGSDDSEGLLSQTNIDLSRDDLQRLGSARN